MPRIPTPLRFTPDDFDSLVAAQGAGGAATRARLHLTSRMVRWARSVARRLEDHGLAVHVVAPSFGSAPRKGRGPDAPRVLIQENDPRAPKSVESGARWALSVDKQGVDVALEIPAAAKGTLASLHAALDDDKRRSELRGLLETLPEPFRFGMGEPGSGAPGVSARDPSAWKAIVERSATTGRSVRIGRNVPRDLAISRSRLLDEELEDAIVLLVPIYKLITQKDDVGVGARGRPKARASAETRRPPLAATRLGEGEEEVESSLERGARVRVLAGPFAGKVGVVKEVDGKGGAHVMLGLLATRIELKDLSASAAGRRPTLSSSHRKPLGLR
jgi:hypothetical protein